MLEKRYNRINCTRGIPLQIRRLTLENFRLVERLEWCPAPGVNCLIGPGDSGKTTLLDAIDEFKFDACIGGARRDEEKARAKERVFSVRNDFGEWDEKNQRPEVFNVLNGKIQLGQNVRVFPISNWTEIDVWNYINDEDIDIPSIYFSHQRNTFERDGLIWAAEDVVYKEEDELVHERTVRYRTVGDMTCTAAVESSATTIEDIIIEIRASSISERGARIDDKRSEAAMEKRKQQGYF